MTYVLHELDSLAVFVTVVVVFSPTDLYWDCNTCLYFQLANTEEYIDGALTGNLGETLIRWVFCLIYIVVAWPCYQKLFKTICCSEQTWHFHVQLILSKFSIDNSTWKWKLHVQYICSFPEGLSRNNLLLVSETCESENFVM